MQSITLSIYTSQKEQKHSQKQTKKRTHQPYLMYDMQPRTMVTM